MKYSMLFFLFLSISFFLNGQNLSNPIREYNPYETNYFRYYNSPCFKKLGYMMPSDDESARLLEKVYQDCEKEYRIKKIVETMTSFPALVIYLVIISRIIYLKYYKNRQESI